MTQDKYDLMGKIPPQALDLEEAVLGALMLERDAFTKVDLFSEIFYKESHRIIYNAIESISKQGKNIDLITVTIELKNNGKLAEIGGPMEVTRLTQKVALAANLEQHVNLLIQYYIRRELIRLSSEIMSLSYDATNEIQDIMQVYEATVNKIDKIIIGKKTGRELKNVLTSLTDEINERYNRSKNGGLSGIDTGFGRLNRITSGWQSGWLVILAARPAMGKTAIGVNQFAKAAARNGNWVCIFSLEMEDITLSERLIVGATGIESERLKSGKLQSHEWTSYTNAVAELSRLPIFIDDTPYVTVSHIRNVARAKKRENKCDLIIIDYLQLANAGEMGKNQNRENQVAEMSRQLKSLAKELKIPVIVLSQLSRDVEKRGGNKKPNMSDLRESGAIEQDADLILFPWRPSYYGIISEVQEPENYGELVFAKNRHGIIEDIEFWHNGTMTDFSDMPFGQQRYNINPF